MSPDELKIYATRVCISFSYFVVVTASSKKARVDGSDWSVIHTCGELASVLPVSGKIVSVFFEHDAKMAVMAIVAKKIFLIAVFVFNGLINVFCAAMCGGFCVENGVHCLPLR
jgi:hypothetical protein